MLRSVLTAVFAVSLIAAFSCGGGQAAADGTYSVDDLQQDYKQLRKDIENLHPALYEFTDEDDFDRMFDGRYTQIDRPMTVEEFYTLIKPVVAKIGCGHARVYSPDGYWRASPDRLFPMELRIVDKRAWAIRYHGEAGSIPLGAEVVSINGRPVAELIETMKSSISADGYNESWKQHRLNSVFIYLYALMVGYPEQFTLAYRAAEGGELQEATLSPVDLDAVRSSEGGLARSGEWIDRDLGFEIIDDRSTAIITIKSFGYYDDREFFYSFIDDSFAKIKLRKIANLILDVRDNDGGDPFCTTHLLGYIEPQPVPYFAMRYPQYEHFARPIPFAEDNVFGGNLLILIDGGGFSSTGHLAAVLKYNGIGAFVGQETGGTYTCNDASKEIILKHTKIRVNLPRMTFAAAVSGMPKTRGILPDYEVEPRIEDILAGRDTIKEFALDLIGEPASR
jgi:hypothetical protein